KDQKHIHHEGERADQHYAKALEEDFLAKGKRINQESGIQVQAKEERQNRNRQIRRQQPINQFTRLRGVFPDVYQKDRKQHARKKDRRAWADGYPRRHLQINGQSKQRLELLQSAKYHIKRNKSELGPESKQAQEKTGSQQNFEANKDEMVDSYELHCS